MKNSISQNMKSCNSKKALLWSVSEFSDKVISSHIGTFVSTSSLYSNYPQRITVKPNSLDLYIESNLDSVELQTLPILGTALQSAQICLFDLCEDSHLNLSKAIHGIIIITYKRLYLVGANVREYKLDRYLEVLAFSDDFDKERHREISLSPSSTIYLDPSTRVAVFQLFKSWVEIAYLLLRNAKTEIILFKLSIDAAITDCCLFSLPLVSQNSSSSINDNKFNYISKAQNDEIECNLDSISLSDKSSNNIPHSTTPYIKRIFLYLAKDFEESAYKLWLLELSLHIHSQAHSISNCIYIDRYQSMLTLSPNFGKIEKMISIPNHFGGGVLIIRESALSYVSLNSDSIKENNLMIYSRNMNTGLRACIPVDLEHTESSCSDKTYSIFWLVAYQNGYIWLLKLRFGISNHEDLTWKLIESNFQPILSEPYFRHISSLTLFSIYRNVIELLISSDRFDQYLVSLELKYNLESEGNLSHTSPQINNLEESKLSILTHHQPRYNIVFIHSQNSHTAEHFKKTVIVSGNGESGLFSIGKFGYKIKSYFCGPFLHKKLWALKSDTINNVATFLISSGNCNSKCWSLKNNEISLYISQASEFCSNAPTIYCSTISFSRITRWIQVTPEELHLYDVHLGRKALFKINQLENELSTDLRIICATSNKNLVVLSISSMLSNSGFLALLELDENRIIVSKIINLQHSPFNFLDSEEGLMIGSIGIIGTVSFYKLHSLELLYNVDLLSKLHDSERFGNTITAIKLVMFRSPLIHILIGFSKGNILSFIVETPYKRKSALEQLVSKRANLASSNKDSSKLSSQNQKLTFGVDKENFTSHTLPNFTIDKSINKTKSSDIHIKSSTKDLNPNILLLTHKQSIKLENNPIEQFINICGLYPKRSIHPIIILATGKHPCILSTLSYGDKEIIYESVFHSDLSISQLIPLSSLGELKDPISINELKVAWLSTIQNNSLHNIHFGHLYGPQMNFKKIPLPGMPHQAVYHPNTGFYILSCSSSTHTLKLNSSPIKNDMDLRRPCDHNIGFQTRIFCFDSISETCVWSSHIIHDSIHEAIPRSISSDTISHFSPKPKGVIPLSLSLGPKSPTFNLENNTNAQYPLIAFGVKIQPTFDDTSNRRLSKHGIIFLYDIHKHPTAQLQLILCKHLKQEPNSIILFRNLLCVQLGTNKIVLLKLSSKVSDATRLAHISGKPTFYTESIQSFDSSLQTELPRMVWSDSPRRSWSKMLSNSFRDTVDNSIPALVPSLKHSSSGITPGEKYLFTPENFTQSVHLTLQNSGPNNLSNLTINRNRMQEEHMQLIQILGQNFVHESLPEHDSDNLFFSTDDNTNDSQPNFYNPTSNLIESNILMNSPIHNFEYLYGSKHLNNQSTKEPFTDFPTPDNRGLIPFETPKMQDPPTLSVQSYTLEPVIRKIGYSNISFISAWNNLVAILDKNLFIYRIPPSITNSCLNESASYAYFICCHELSFTKCWILKNDLFLSQDEKYNIFLLHRPKTPTNISTNLEILSAFNCLHSLSQVTFMSTKLFPTPSQQVLDENVNNSKMEIFLWSSYDGAYGTFSIIPNQLFQRFETLELVISETIRKKHFTGIIEFPTIEDLKQLSLDDRKKDDYLSIKLPIGFYFPTYQGISRCGIIDLDMIKRFLKILDKEKQIILSQLQQIGEIQKDKINYKTEKFEALFKEIILLSLLHIPGRRNLS